MLSRLILILLAASSTGERLPLHPWGEPVSPDLELKVLRNAAYDCGYSPRLKVARWVSYIYSSTGSPRTPRRGRFRPDPRLDSTATAYDADYRNSGFDRGHLAPDASIKVFGAQAQSETYYFSNIIPQNPPVNRGVWRALEDSVRAWAGTRDTVWTIVGPLWHRNMDTLWLGRSRIAVPHACFAVVRRTRTPDIISFLVPNAARADSIRTLTSFLVSVDSIERLTGLDLLPALPTGIAARLESARPETLWRAQP